MSEELVIGLDPALAEDDPLEGTPGGVEPPEEPTESAEPPEEPAEGEGEPEGETTPAENLPSQVVKLARELSRERPEIANTVKYMRDRVFAAQDYEKTFGDIDTARNLKATIEAIGGEEGLVELQSAAEDLRALDERVSQGDPQVIDAMVSEAPEGFKKLISAGLDRLSQIDPEAYENAIRTPLVRVLMNVGERLAEADQWIEAGQPEFARRQLGAIVNWIREQQGATQKPQMGPDPRLQEIEQRESRLRESEDMAFVSEVGRDAVPYVKSKVFDALKPQMDAAKLSPEAKNALFRDVMQEFDRLDSTQSARWKALVRSRDASRAVSYVKARADASAERIARQIWQTRYGNVSPVVQKGGNGAARPQVKAKPALGSGTEANPLRIPKMPPDSEIDRTYSNWQMALITGKAKLKSGKFVTWKGR